MKLHFDAVNFRDISPPICVVWWKIVAQERRFSRWAKKGVWQQVVKVATDDPDLEALLIDSTIVRVHQQGTGALKKMENKPSDVPVAD